MAASAVVLFFLFFPGRAEAYVDPASGSYILQLILAGFLGALFALKVFWHRLVGFFKGLFARRPES